MIKKLKYINGESILNLIFIILGVIWTISGVKLGLWAETTPGPGLFPLIVGILLTVLSFVVFAKSLHGLEDSKKISAHEKNVLLFSIGIAAICAVLLNVLGTFFTLAVGLIIWFKLIAKYSWVKTLVCVIGIVGVIYAVFAVWLSVPFPKFFGLF